MVFIPFELPQPFSFETQLHPLKGYGHYSFPSGNKNTAIFSKSSQGKKHKAPKGKGFEDNNIINNKEFIDNHASV